MPERFLAKSSQKPAEIPVQRWQQVIYNFPTGKKIKAPTMHIFKPPAAAQFAACVVESYSLYSSIYTEIMVINGVQSTNIVLGTQTATVLTFPGIFVR